MKRTTQSFALAILVLGALSTPVFGAVAITSMRPSRRAPQDIGKSITWTAKATDSNSGPLTFQFNVAPPGGHYLMVRDFNVGTLSSGVWTAQPFQWAPTVSEGIYRVQVVIKDFASGETTSKTVNYRVKPLVTGTTPVVVRTANSLVALFSAPSCAAGSSMRVSFQPQSGSTPAGYTNWVNCQPPHTMTFEIAGMYPDTAYQMFSQTQTGTGMVNGPTLTYTSGALPKNIPFGAFKSLVKAGPNTDTTDWVILHNMIQFQTDRFYANVATDLAGKIIWYYAANPAQSIALTRLLPNGTFIEQQAGTSWNPTNTELQILRQIDLAGNVVKETNTGIIQQQLLAMGATDGGPCNAISSPAPIGAACLGSFHHDAIQTLPGGFTAVLVDIEKIFPPGTQGDTSGLPVDIMGDMILVLDRNWQVVWYFDTFEHDSGPPQLDINRGPLLGQTCVNNFGGCPPIYLLGPGIAPKAYDWLHANSLYYWPQTGDIIFSSRHQDWLMRVDYKNGKGTGNILWRMGKDGDFAFNNVNNDPYPWFSGQHEAGIEDNGAGVLTLFDNGNTRLSPPPLGLGSGCKPADCHSRGMVLNFDETSMQVTPLLSVDLGVYSQAMGSAQLLSNGDYFFVPAIVPVSANEIDSFDIEILPTGGTITGTQVLNLQGKVVYRCWQMPDLYHPPIT